MTIREADAGTGLEDEAGRKPGTAESAGGGANMKPNGHRKWSGKRKTLQRYGSHMERGMRNEVTDNKGAKDGNH